jgi:hypothetical protein
MPRPEYVAKSLIRDTSIYFPPMIRVALLALTTLGVARDVSAQAIDYSLEATATFFGDNTEFFNPFRTGRTLIGTDAFVVGEARTSERLAIRAGVFGLQSFGADRSLDQVRPVLSLVIGPPKSRLILGTLETVRRSDGPGPDRTSPHGLLPPMQIETLAFERPWEAGLQWLYTTPRLKHDAWLHWQRINHHDQREVFDTGYTARVRVSRTIGVRADVFLVHEGGQLTSRGVVADSFSSAIGVDLGGRAGVFDRVGFEANVLASRFVPDRARPADSRSGLGTFLRVSAERSSWRGHAIVWRGDDFIAREGDPLYQSRFANGIGYRLLRDYSEVGLTRLFPLAERSWLEVSLRGHHVEQHYEYSFRILAIARLRID